MVKHLKGRNAVVTGAGRGIGRAVAIELASQGANVVVNDIGGSKAGEGVDPSQAQKVVEEINKAGGSAIANHDSVADFAAAERIIRNCVDSFGRIDILVNCAGILRDRMLFNMSGEEWNAVLAIHLGGTFNTIRHASRLMREQKYGRIVNTTSDAWRGAPGQSNYSAAKGGIVSLTRTAAGELGKYGVTVNCIAPIAATRMTLDKDVRDRLERAFQAGTLTQDEYEEFANMPGPEFVAPVVAYLATDNASTINGKVIGCSGGRVALYSDPVEIRGIYKDHKKEGAWTVEDLIRLVPKTLLA